MESNHWQIQNRVISDIEILNPMEHDGLFARFELTLNGRRSTGEAFLSSTPDDKKKLVVCLDEDESRFLIQYRLKVNDVIAEDVLAVITAIYGPIFNARIL